MSSTSVSQIMSRDLDTVTPDQPLLDVKHIYEKMDFHHHIPVLEDDRLVGIVSLTDFMQGIGQSGYADNEPVYNTLKVSDVMTSNPESLDETNSIEDAARILGKGEFHSLPIVKDSRLVGIVTTTDLIRYSFGLAIDRS